MPCTREVVNLNNIKSQSLLHYAMIKLWSEKNEIHVKTQNKVSEYFI